MSNGVPPPPPAGPPSYAPPPPTAKKGLSPLAWAGIGCGVLVLLAGVVVVVLGGYAFKKGRDFVAEVEANPAKAGAEMMVRLNPELELVESDDEAGTMTIRNTKTGEVVTVDYEEMAEGRVSWTTEEGTVTIDSSDAAGGGMVVETKEGRTVFGGTSTRLPAWVPLPDDATQTGSLHATEGGDKVSGTVVYDVTQDHEELVAFYVEELEGAGYEVETSKMEYGGTRVGTVTGRSGDRTVNAMVNTEGGKTQLTLNYEGPGATQ